MAELSVKEAADLLRVSETTLQRWIRQGVIPTLKVREEYRFNREALEDWARAKHISGQSQGGDGRSSEEAVNLARAVSRGGIHHGLRGNTTEDLYSGALARLPLKEVADADITREAIVSTLLEREKLVSTGIGQGIAIPHPRQPRDWGLGEPVVAVFFLEGEHDLKAIDGKPVFVLFLLLCATIKGHLKMLSQVSHLVNSSEMQAFLRTRPRPDALLEKISDVFPE